MYYVVITPRTGPQYRLNSDYPDLDTAIMVATIEQGRKRGIVGLEVLKSTLGGYALAWEWRAGWHDD